MRFAAPLFAALLLLGGCANNEPAATQTNAATTPMATNAAPPVPTIPPPGPVSSTPGPVSSTPDVAALVNQSGTPDSGLPKTAGFGAKTPKAGDPIAIIHTDMGRIVLRFFPQVAPNHVKNFIDLAKKGFYNGTLFHRVIPGFMIQGGDPNTKNPDKTQWGQGGPGYTINAEFNDISHQPGILSMARTNDPNSAGSQFFIVHQAHPDLDNQYTVFGEVLEGMDVVDKIANSPRDDADRPLTNVPIKVEIVTWPVKLVDNAKG